VRQGRAIERTTRRRERAARVPDQRRRRHTGDRPEGSLQLLRTDLVPDARRELRDRPLPRGPRRLRPAHAEPWGRLYPRAHFATYGTRLDPCCVNGLGSAFVHSAAGKQFRFHETSEYRKHPTLGWQKPFAARVRRP
jgi:hypothetical protein